MLKKGLVHLLPLSIIALMLLGSFAFLAFSQEKRQKEAVGRVLSSSDSEDDGSGSQDSNSGSSQDDHSGSSNSQDSSGSSSGSSSSSGSGSSDAVKVESRTETGKTKIETKPAETKVKIKTPEGKFETKVEESKREIKVRTDTLRIEIKQEGSRLVTKVKDEQDKEVELEPEDEDELVDLMEEELADKGIRLATGEAQLGFIQHGRRVRTNFPLSVNPATGELFVTTPAGEKAVTVLPDQAIANMIAAGVITRVIEEPAPLASPAPGESTPSVSTAGAGVELTQFNNKPVFLIRGVKSERFLGLVPVGIDRRTVVSAEDGQLLDVQEGLFARILDFVSF